MDLRRLIVLARAWLPLALVCAALAGVAGFLVSNLEQPVYEARTRLIVGQALSAANPDYSQLQVAQNLSATYAVVAENGPDSRGRWKQAQPASVARRAREPGAGGCAAGQHLPEHLSPGH